MAVRTSPGFLHSGYGYNLGPTIPRALRTPPGVLSSDIAFVWDPRHNYLADTLNGITLTPTSAPLLTERAGAACVSFDGVDDFLSGALAIGDWDETFTAYTVGEVVNSGTSLKLFSAYKASAPTSEAAWSNLRNAGGTGAAANKREAAGQGSDNAGGVAALGKIHLGTAQIGTATVEAWLDGVSNGSTAATQVPRGIDSVEIGAQLGGTGLVEGFGYYTLLVRGLRDASVEAWINSNFPVGTSP